MVEIRANEAAKVPLYTKALENVIKRSKKIGLEKALAEWAQEITKRRMAWFEEHKNQIKLKGTDVEKAFQLVLFEYMKLKPEEVPIIEKTDRKIVWRSYDFCPYLEAINKLGMNTRIVCRCATHSPVQVMIETINPKLLFSRNYVDIRPYADYCEEIIELSENQPVYPYLPENRKILYVDHKNKYIKEATAMLANSGCVKQPTAAVIVSEGRIIGRGVNAGKRVDVCPRVTLNCPTGTGYDLCKSVCEQKGHAEVMAIKDALENNHTTKNASLYLDGHWWVCEPCWKEIIKAGISKVFLRKDSMMYKK